MDDLCEGNIDKATNQYEGITYMPCSPSNDFFPELSLAKVVPPNLTETDPVFNKWMSLV